jgi:hypothetical protein
MQILLLQGTGNDLSGLNGTFFFAGIVCVGGDGIVNEV